MKVAECAEEDRLFAEKARRQQEVFEIRKRRAAQEVGQREETVRRAEEQRRADDKRRQQIYADINLAFASLTDQHEVDLAGLLFAGRIPHVKVSTD